MGVSGVFVFHKHILFFFSFLQNIELKVECESYKKDIEEKKELLEKAS